MVDQTSIAKDIDPAHGPDDKADPERGIMISRRIALYLAVPSGRYSQKPGM
jgi:hypothetical protein